MISFTIKQQVKSTVQELAMSGLKRLAMSYIERNPYVRMHQISKGVFNGIDHKQMLASVVVRQLVIEGKVVKHQPVRLFNGKCKRDQFGNLVRYKHFVYSPSVKSIVESFTYAN